MKSLVFGATGTVGSLVVKELLARDVSVRALTRSAEKARALPARVEAAIGDATDPDTLWAPFNGVDSVFLLHPVSMTETHEGMMALNVAVASGVKRIVYMSVQNVAAAPLIPHLASKVPLERALKSSGIPYTILQPNNFFQNDLWFKDAIVAHGVYPQPIGDIGLSRVDARDIAEAAAIALTKPGFENRSFVVAGPHTLTGTQTAQVYTEHLGRKVVYGGNDLDAWERQARTMLPGWMVFDFKIMYRYFQRSGITASATDLAELTELLGRAPRTFDAFAAECADAWR